MSRLLSVSVPDEMLYEAEALAAVQGRSKSEVVREALRRYILRERLVQVQSHGRLQAEVRGIGPEDVEDLIDTVRRE